MTVQIDMNIQFSGRYKLKIMTINTKHTDCYKFYLRCLFLCRISKNCLKMSKTICFLQFTPLFIIFVSQNHYDDIYD